MIQCKKSQKQTQDNYKNQSPLFGKREPCFQREHSNHAKVFLKISPSTFEKNLIGIQLTTRNRNALNVFRLRLGEIHNFIASLLHLIAEIVLFPVQKEFRVKTTEFFHRGRANHHDRSRDNSDFPRAVSFPVLYPKSLRDRIVWKQPIEKRKRDGSC